MNTDNQSFFDSKPKILVVDDLELNRLLLSDMLMDHYDILEAENGLKAIQILKENWSVISLVLLDYLMPKMNGFEVLKTMRSRGWLDFIPVIMITAETNDTFVDEAYDLGVMDFISRPFDVSIVNHRVNNAYMLSSKQKYLEEIISSQIMEKSRQSDMLVNVLSHIVEFRNGESEHHVLNVRMITQALLEELNALKTTSYTKEEIEMYSLASSLHDIGKISIPEEILNKPGRFTKEEFEKMKKHTTIGYEMMKALPKYQDDPLVEAATNIARWHHERYDGNGYPDHLKGSEIPIYTQVTALADVYDALVTKRVYKNAYSHEKALSMILNGECGVFQPELLQALVNVQPIIMEKLNNHDSIGKEVSLRSVSEVMAHSNVAEQIHVLSYERNKYDFFARNSQEIQFEYTCSSNICTLSQWAAQKYHLNEVIFNPFQYPGLIRLLGKENMETIRRTFARLDPHSKDEKIDLKIETGDGFMWIRMSFRGLFSEDGTHTLNAVFGLMSFMDDDKKEKELLRIAASHDGLTGLINQEHAPKIAQKRLEHHPERNYALAIIDIDYFKHFNDEFGHPFGDEVLKAFSAQIKKCIRSTDFAARIGGDEFLIMIQYKNNYQKAMHRIFNALQIEYKNQPIRCSMGVAITSENLKDYPDLYKAADIALYASKNGGRSQLTFYNTMRLT